MKIPLKVIKPFIPPPPHSHPSAPGDGLIGGSSHLEHLCQQERDQWPVPAPQALVQGSDRPSGLPTGGLGPHHHWWLVVIGLVLRDLEPTGTVLTLGSSVHAPSVI